jgi:hypothetical protein
LNPRAIAVTTMAGARRPSTLAPTRTARAIVRAIKLYVKFAGIIVLMLRALPPLLRGALTLRHVRILEQILRIINTLAAASSLCHLPYI